MLMLKTKKNGLFTLGFLVLGLSFSLGASAAGLSNEQKEALAKEGMSAERIEQIDTAASISGTTYTPEQIAKILESNRQNPENVLSQKDADEVASSLQGDRTGLDNPADLLALDSKAGAEWAFSSSSSDKVRVLVHVDLEKGKTAQYFEVYLNGTYQWSGFTSLAKPGKSTPNGTFTLKERDIDHWSSTYNSPMPYYHRLASAWGIHETPHETMLGMPASMGCTRISHEDAVRLWNLTTGIQLSNMEVTYLDSGAPRNHEPKGVPPYIAYAKYNAESGSGGIYFKDVPAKYQPTSSSGGGGFFGGLFH